VKFLKWKLYNEFGSPDIARYLNSLFYHFKVVLFYNDCMREDVEKTKAEVAIEQIEPTATNTTTETESVTETTSAEQAPLIAYNLTDKQSVIVGHTYVVKVDSLLRCPVFESNEKNVFDIDGVLTSYYECSDTDCDDHDQDDDDDDSSSQSSDDSACENEADRDEGDGDGDGDGVTADENDNTNTEQKSDYDETEFEVIQESTT
jgi:hypothetical protein